MTSNALAGDRERCLVVGMNDYVSKPVDAAKLRVALERALAPAAAAADLSATTAGRIAGG